MHKQKYHNSQIKMSYRGLNIFTSIRSSSALNLTVWYCRPWLSMHSSELERHSGWCCAKKS